MPHIKAISVTAGSESIIIYNRYILHLYDAIYFQHKYVYAEMYKIS